MTDLSGEPSVLLYGIFAAGAAEDTAVQSALEDTGVHGAPLTLLSCPNLAVLVSPLRTPDALATPDVDTVLTYKETVDAAYDARPLVPLRFGTWTDTPEAARALVTERADACRARLDELGGHVEMGIRLTLDADPQPDSTADAADAPSGTAYLRARKQRHDRVRRPLDETLKRYREALASRIAADSTTNRSDEGTASAAFLVPRPDAEAFARRASQVEPAAGVKAQVVGPWAPFSFASLSL